jgi:hypothetical protein
MVDGEYCILREEMVRKRRGSYSGFCCRLYPFICWIIIKEGPVNHNFSGGRSPHWVNHVNLCLWIVLCIFCVLFPTFVLFYCSLEVWVIVVICTFFLSLPLALMATLKGFTILLRPPTVAYRQHIFLPL